ncbi:MAG: MFS transporter [Desulfuromonas sp.]|nr:MFS transporter [Desulfuromonas sp.]
MGIFALTSALCRPWIAPAIDHFGRRRCYLWGCSLMVLLPLCYLPFISSSDLNHILFAVVRGIHGVGLALCFTTVFTWVADLLPKERLNEGLGVFGVSGLVGLAVGPFIGEMILDHFGFTQFFIAASLLALLSLFLVTRLQETTAHHANSIATGFFELLRRPHFRNCALTTFLFGIGLAAPGAFIATYLEAHQLPSIALYYFAYSAAAIMIRFLAGHLGDRYGEEQVLPYAITLTAAGILSILIITDLWTVMLAGLVIGCGHGLLFPALNSLTLRHSPMAIRGKLTGIFTGSLDLGIFLGSLLCGVLGEYLGWTALFSVAAAAVLSGILLTPALKRSAAIRASAPQEM